MSEKTLDFDVVLDRIISITEKNLSMQQEFLQAVHELRIRFDSLDRDNKELDEDSRVILNNTFEIIEKMKLNPNEKIIDLLEKVQEKILILQEIQNNLQGCASHNQGCVDHRQISLEVKDDVKEIKDSFKIIKRVLQVIALSVIGFQIIFGIYTTFNFDKISKNLRQEIKKELKNGR